VDSNGRTIFVADAHRDDDDQRFIVRADESVTAFVEFESAISRRVPPSDGLAVASYRFAASSR
jgi:hypothetical protein